MQPLTRLSDERTVCVLLSYERPHNLQAILDSVVKSGIFDQIILSNNNPDHNIGNYLKDTPNSCRIIQQKEHRPCFERVEIAAQSDGQFFFFTDDDLYLYPEDIRNLMTALLKDSTRPHGAFGKSLSSDGISEETGADYRECDILNRVYCLTGDQAKQSLMIRDQLLLKFPELADSISSVEDIIISSSGDKRAMLHRLNCFIPDPDGFDPNVAVWGRPGFRDLRIKVFNFLQLNDFYSDSDHA